MSAVTPSLIKDPRNFWVGAMFLCVGAAAILIALDYDMGSAGAMGPAYFPSLLGGLLVLVGACGVLRSALVAGEAIEPFALRRLALVAGALVVFGLVLRGAGLVPAVMVLVAGSSLASDSFRPGRVALLSLGLALFSYLVFVSGLGLPLQAFGSWFGG